MGEKMTQTVADLLDELASVSAMIGYATSGAERNNHKAMRDKIKAEILARLAQPAQAVDVGAIRCIAKLLRALSPDGEEWRSSNPNNAAVLDLRKLADKLTAALPKGVGS